MSFRKKLQLGCYALIGLNSVFMLIVTFATDWNRLLGIIFLLLFWGAAIPSSNGLKGS
ncbi:hypothetical protein [Paenibacillus sp. SYP-B3998]|uniref:hypothetical protein n=1 Tax=Paenibacillus sp. SYP-B3998 TaxID=2678564 RepID=UPI0031F8351A